MVDWNTNGQVATDILTLAGKTPTLALTRMSEDIGVKVFAKLEFFNPSGSLKDRVYLKMIEDAESRGELKPGMTVLECSTGNAGISCAMVSAVKGYPCIIVMPEGMSEERHKTIRAYGAKLLFTPGGESDVDLALAKTEELAGENPDKYWIPRQFSNPSNVLAHYETTAVELFEQCGEHVDAFLATQGTGGTLTGVGRYFREHKPDTKLFAVEPAECPLLSRREWGPHQIEGIGDGFVPRNLDLSLLDGVITVSSEEAIEMAKELPRKEGIFTGISSGANLVAAKKLAGRFPELSGVATMINDNGQRYFSTALSESKREVDIPKREHPMDEYSLRQLAKYSPGWVVIH
ncbi:MAG: PLP-dependent cysteine synthase family protein [Clostridia bacterium]